MDNYRTTADTAALPAGPTWQPARPPAARPDIGVPLLSAGVTTALIAGVPAWPLILWDITGPAIALAAGIADVVLLGAWIMERNLLRRTLWAVQERPAAPPAQPAPAPDAHPFPVGAYQPTRQQVEDAWHTDLAWFVATCYRIGKCGEKAMIGRQMPDGKRLTEKAYKSIVGSIIGSRYAAWKDPLDHSRGWAFVPGLTADQIISGLKPL
jgi:hypothetical protein